MEAEAPQIEALLTSTSPNTEVLVMDQEPPTPAPASSDTAGATSRPQPNRLLQWLALYQTP